MRGKLPLNIPLEAYISDAHLLLRIMAVFKDRSLFIWKHVKKMLMLPNEQLTQGADGKTNNAPQKKSHF